MAAAIDDFGVVFSEQTMPDDPTKLVQAVDLYFLPSARIFDDSYFDIDFPWEVTLPGVLEYDESLLRPEENTSLHFD